MRNLLPISIWFVKLVLRGSSAWTILEIDVGDSVSGGDAQDFPYHLSLADLDNILAFVYTSWIPNNLPNFVSNPTLNIIVFKNVTCTPYLPRALIQYHISFMQVYT